MGREKRKGLPENAGGISEKKTKKDVTATATATEVDEPTDEEVEEFYVILRRMKQAAEYFGVERGMLTKTFRAVVSPATDEEKEEEAAPAVAKRRGKEKEVVEENGLRLDLNIAVAVESDSR